MPGDDGSKKARPGRTRWLLAGSLLLVGCVQPAPTKPDVDLEELRPPEIGPAAALAYTGGSGSPSKETFTIGYISQDGAGSSGARVAVNAINEELGGFAGRTGRLDVCSVPVDQSERICAQQLRGADVIITGYTPTDPQGLSNELDGIAVTGIDPRSRAEEQNPAASHFVLGRYGVVRAAAAWTQRHTNGDVLVVLDETSGERDLLTDALGMIGSAERSLTTLELYGNQEQRSRNLEEATGVTGLGVVILNVSPENCVLAARALAGRKVSVITHGICSTREVHDVLGDWTENWVHVADGPDLANYDDDLEAGYYRARFEKENPEGDWTGWSGLAFSAVMNVAKAANASGGVNMAAALRGLEGEGYASAVPLNCPPAGKPDSRCLRYARFYVYSGKRSWVAAEQSSLLELPS